MHFGLLVLHFSNMKEKYILEGMVGDDLISWLMGPSQIISRINQNPTHLHGLVYQYVSS